MAEKSPVKALPTAQKRATMEISLTVVVCRADLEQEHRLLMASLHILRKQLGYAPLTQKEQARQAKK